LFYQFSIWQGRSANDLKEKRFTPGEGWGGLNKKNLKEENQTKENEKMKKWAF
jgi:hypothetical protein